MYTMVNATPEGVLYKCRCGLKIRSAYPPERVHHQCMLGVVPILSRLAELTHHPEIIDQPRSYARAAQRWAAGVVCRTVDGREVRQIDPFETRDDKEVEFIQALCQKNVCGKHHNGVCKPSCGTGMIIEVSARMASEGCPWAWSRW